MGVLKIKALIFWVDLGALDLCATLGGSVFYGSVINSQTTKPYQTQVVTTLEGPGGLANKHISTNRMNLNVGAAGV